MASNTAWVIGSIKNMNHGLTVGVTPKTVSGSRYLYHPTATFSILAAMATAIGGVAVLTRDRRVKLSAGGIFSITWTNDELRELLGFTGPLAAASSYIAPHVSPLLFSPGKPLLSELSPRGTLGISRPLAYYSMSPTDGTTFVVSHGNRTDQRFSATHVDIERVYTSAMAGGEWVRWFDTCPARGYSFHIYLDVNEEAGSTVIASLDTRVGPYVWAPAARAPAWDYRRAKGFEWTDFLADVTLTCRDVIEYA
jgi:hypothetical protein